MAVGIADRVRGHCLELPGVTEKPSHGGAAFFAGKQFVMLWPSGHHDRPFPHLWCAAEPGVQEALVATSDRYFRPPYVGHRGWVGLRLDDDMDAAELRELIEDAYRAVAPKRSIAELDARG